VLLPGARSSQEEILTDSDLAPARKEKTMTKHRTGDREVERDLRENENSAPGANGENDDRLHERCTFSTCGG